MREDWIECSLGEVCFTTSGGTPSRQNKDFYNGNIPWVKSGELDKGIIYDSEEHISEEAIKKSSAKIFPKGTLLFALYGATIGKMATLGVDAATNQAICGIYKSDALNSEYLYHNLFFQKNFLIQQGIGGAQPNISQTILKKLDIPLPPLVEQKAIVKKIEELFSSLDSGIADLKKAQDQLVIYRQAVLKKAFEGIKEFKPLKECGEWKGGGTPSRQIKEYWENGKIPWVSSRDVKTKEIHDTERHITEIAIPNSSTKWIEENSLLFVMRSGILRRIFPIAIAKTKLCVNQDIQTVSLDANWNSEYVYWFLLGNESDIRHSCSKDGTTVESIDANSLKAYLVPFCSLKQQHQIVQEIESRLSVCDKVEKDLTDSLEKAQALRQSILKKAFEGKLLSEDEIATCKADKDYEPASVLLERIKKEKKQK
tara:strand:- start:4273 stop:5550 length:1278 start_codon:yes stop_codon:yes gene_type:complete